MADLFVIALVAGRFIDVAHNTRRAGMFGQHRYFSGCSRQRGAQRRVATRWLRYIAIYNVPRRGRSMPAIQAGCHPGTERR